MSCRIFWRPLAALVESKIAVEDAELCFHDAEAPAAQLTDEYWYATTLVFRSCKHDEPPWCQKVQESLRDSVAPMAVDDVGSHDDLCSLLERPRLAQSFFPSKTAAGDLACGLACLGLPGSLIGLDVVSQILHGLLVAICDESAPSEARNGYAQQPTPSADLQHATASYELGPAEQLIRESNGSGPQLATGGSVHTVCHRQLSDPQVHLSTEWGRKEHIFNKDIHP